MKVENPPAVPEKCINLSLFYDQKTWLGSCSFDIYLKKDDSNLIQLTHCELNKDMCVSPSWSPDGKWIAYLRSPGGALAGHLNGLFLMKSDCLSQPEKCEKSAIGPFNLSSGFEWSPDSRYIASDSNGNIQVYRLSVNGLILYKDLMYASNQGSLSWTPDGNSIVYTYFNSVYIVNIEDGQPKLIFQSKTDILINGVIQIVNLPSQ